MPDTLVKGAARRECGCNNEGLKFPLCKATIGRLGHVITETLVLKEWEAAATRIIKEMVEVQQETSALQHFHKTFLVAEWGSVKESLPYISLNEGIRLVDEI